jgi:hypothetical protein
MALGEPVRLNLWRRVPIQLIAIALLVAASTAASVSAYSQEPERRLGNAEIDTCASGMLTPARLEQWVVISVVIRSFARDSKPSKCKEWSSTN